MSQRWTAEDRGPYIAISDATGLDVCRAWEDDTAALIIESVNGWDDLAIECARFERECRSLDRERNKLHGRAEVAEYERDATRKILDSILAAEDAYRKALDDDYGGEHLANAFHAVWVSLEEAQAAVKEMVGVAGIEPATSRMGDRSK